MRGDQLRDPLQKLTIILPESCRAVGVDVDLAHHAAFVADRDNDLAPRRREAGEVAIVGVHVVDDLGAAARSSRAADALADGDPYVLSRLGALPRPEHEVVALDEVDPDPGVVVEAVVEGSTAWRRT